MEHLSSDMEHQQNQLLQLQWRRDKVQELCSKVYSQREISQVLQVGLDLYLRNPKTMGIYNHLVAEIIKKD
jgi:hypothetical protein